MNRINSNCYTALIFTLLATLNLGCNNAAEPHHRISKESNSNAQIKSEQKVKSLDHFKRGEMIPDVSCSDDASQSYALYIPKVDSGKALPVVYFFDSHGAGAFPLKMYQSLADNFHYILVGSNNSKNGNDFTTAENIWNILFADTKNRLNIDEHQIYTVGFSGGAKVATFLALQYPEIKGTVANGAGLDEILQAGNFKFSYTAITGEGDLNMTQIVGMENRLMTTQTNHRILFFDGIHEWAPENSMYQAFAGFQLDGMKDGSIPKDSDFIQDFISKSKDLVNQLKHKGKYVRAEQTCTYSIDVLRDLTTDVNWFKEEDNRLKNSAAYQKENQVRQQLLSKEEKIKTEYQQYFQPGTMTYWNQTIKEVQQKAKASTPEGPMYQRLNAYLSLAFYSLSKRLIQSHNNEGAQFFVQLYKTVDPTNSEAWYFSALLDARNNQVDAVKKNLLKSVSLGFNDRERMEQDPDFQSTEIRNTFDEIENKMKSI